MVGFSSCCKEVEASKGVMLNGEIPMRLSEAVTIGIDWYKQQQSLLKIFK